MITIKGKTIKRKDIIWQKGYFDSLQEKKYPSGVNHSSLPDVDSKSDDGGLNPDGSKKSKVFIFLLVM